MATTLTYTGRLTIVTCWCGIAHAIPDDLDSWADQSASNVVYCPLGHKWVRRETAVARERKEREQLQRRLDAERDTSRRWRDRAEAERRSAIAYKGHLTRIRRRIANGVCPVPGCKRSGFSRVLSHIASQHPDWLHDHPEITDGSDA